LPPIAVWRYAKRRRTPPCAKLWHARLPDGSGKVEAAGAKAICEKDALPLGHDIIHSVTNPIPRLTGARHVYGGDFFARGRKEWDPETLREQDRDGEKMPYGQKTETS
jgi:hypothetical protein